MSMNDIGCLDISKIIDRIRLFLNAKSDRDLSIKIGKSPTFITQCKLRKALDFELIFNKCNNADLNWLVTGEKNSIKSIADIDSKGNRVELTSVTKISGTTCILQNNKTDNAVCQSDIEIKCLGFGDGCLHYWTSKLKRIVSIPEFEHNELSLLVLAPYEYWKLLFPMENSVDWLAAASFLITHQDSGRVFDHTKYVKSSTQL